VPTAAEFQILGYLYATVGGRDTSTRPAFPNDLNAVNAMHTRASLASRYSRYHTARGHLTPADWQRLTSSDRGLTWVTQPADDDRSVIAVCHLMHNGSGDVGELSMLVEDAWQDAGLGTALAHHALRSAQQLGMQAVHVMTQHDNRRMLSICRRLGGVIPRPTGPTVDLVLPVTGQSVGTYPATELARSDAASSQPLAGATQREPASLPIEYGARRPISTDRVCR
jgi:RimJ/RimL family protein N-acetyltransferase